MAGLRGDLASQAIQLVNAHRASLGLRTLAVSPGLAASAAWKARHMAAYAYLAHNDPAPPVARSAAERLVACGYSAGWGEIVGAGYQTAQAIVAAWLGSPGHRANIENPTYVAIGSGAAAGGAGVYWAQDYGTTGDSPPPPPATTAGTTTAGTTTTAPPATTASPTTATSTPPAAPSTAAAAGPALVLRGLRLVPRPPKANRRIAGTVSVLRRGKRVSAGRVVCRARIGARALPVVVHRFRRSKATCVWRVPAGARGKLIRAVIAVASRDQIVRAPFRARVH